MTEDNTQAQSEKDVKEQSQPQVATQVAQEVKKENPASDGMEAVKIAKGLAAHSENMGRGGSNQKGDRKPRGNRGQRQQDEENPYIEKVLTINRVAKATKGGTKLSFSALVVVGDGKGRVGFCLGKGNEVATAIRKAMATAKKNMIKIPMNGSTIPHEIVGEWCGAQVLLKPAGEGTGVIASSAVRSICDGAGIHNILTKCHRSNNALNIVRATLEGLKQLKTADHYARLTGKN